MKFLLINANINNIRFYWDIEEEMHNSLFYSDKWKIRQILLNLISNSYKFTFEGSISISIVEILINNQSFIEFSVSDTGVGIKKEDQEKLFKLYGMIKENSNLNPNGTGIGLTVSK